MTKPTLKERGVLIGNPGKLGKFIVRYKTEGATFPAYDGNFKTKRRAKAYARYLRKPAPEFGYKGATSVRIFKGRLKIPRGSGAKRG